MVARHLLDQRAAAVVLEDEEVAHQRQQPAPAEDAFEQHLKLRQARVRQPFAGDRAPRLEPLPARRQRAEARLQPVRHHERGAQREQRRNLGLVGLKLPEGRVDRRILVGGVLQLDHDQRQSVDEQHDVGPPFAAVLDHGELVHREPVVVVRVVEVEHPHLGAAHPAVGVGVLHGDAGDQHAVEVAVAGLQRRPRRARQSAQGVFERVVGQVGIEPGEGVAQPAVQHHLAVVGALGRRRVGRHVRPVQHAPTERCEPIEGRDFDGGFGERHQSQAPLPTVHRPFDRLAMLVDLGAVYELTRAEAQPGTVCAADRLIVLPLQGVPFTLRLPGAFAPPWPGACPDRNWPTTERTSVTQDVVQHVERSLNARRRTTVARPRDTLALVDGGLFSAQMARRTARNVREIR